LAVDSLHIFSLLLLNAQPQSVENVREYIPKLQACLLKYSSTCETVPITAVCDIIANFDLTVLSNSEIWNPLVDSAVALLESPSSTIYAAGCGLLRILTGCAQSTSSEDAVCDALVERLLFLTSPTPMRLASILLRGMLSTTTFAGSLWLTGLLCKENKVLSVECVDSIAVIGSLVYGVLTGQKVFHAAQSASSFAKGLSKRYGAAADAFAQAFSNMDESSLPVNQQHSSFELLSTCFFPAFISIFGKPAHQLLAIDVIIALLRKGQKRWRPMLLEILSLYLGPPGDISKSVSPLSDSQLMHCYELVVFFSKCSTSPSPVAEAANHALMNLFAHQPVPKGCNIRFFDCSREVPADVATEDSSPELFSAVYPEEAVKLAAKCTESFANNVLHDEKADLAQCTLMDVEGARSITKNATAAATFQYDVLTTRRGRTQPPTLASDEKRAYDKLQVHITAGMTAQEDFLPSMGTL